MNLPVTATRLDHLVVTAPTLESGKEYVRRSLGVSPQMGGEHERMGTHNLLLRIGASAYLEVIAVNPAAPAARPRWFDLDHLPPHAAPRLASWVVRTTDIDRIGKVAQLPIGPVETMSRGDLHWLIALPENGSLILDGLCPYLIQWVSREHPASRLPDLGFQLLSLHAVHPEPERVVDYWRSLDLEDPPVISRGEPPRLEAHFATPSGPRRLN